MRLPAFGAGLDELRSEPNTPATHREIEDRISRELRGWEPRAQLESVEVTADPGDAAGRDRVDPLPARRRRGQPTRLAVAVPLGG